MKISILKVLSLLLFISVNLKADAQKYETVGAVQYQKLDGYNYRRTAVDARISASWAFYPDKQFVRVLDGNKGVTDILSVKKSGTKTIYTIKDYQDHVIIIDGQTVTDITGANQETKTVFKIVKTEKIIGPYGED